jgi:hypothetical protein
MDGEGARVWKLGLSRGAAMRVVVGSWKGRRSGRQGWPGLLAAPAKSKRKSKQKQKQNKIIIIKILVMINKMK